jgi:hypothetical protein
LKVFVTGCSFSLGSDPATATGDCMSSFGEKAMKSTTNGYTGCIGEKG